MLDERSGAVFEAEALEGARESSPTAELSRDHRTVDHLERPLDLGRARRMTLSEFVDDCQLRA
jgi:hypothetical protein